jgi:hypothetical protein
MQGVKASHIPWAAKAEGRQPKNSEPNAINSCYRRQLQRHFWIRSPPSVDPLGVLLCRRCLTLLTSHDSKRMWSNFLSISS